jgi:hypothetical protein
MIANVSQEDAASIFMAEESYVMTYVSEDPAISILRV